MSMSFARAVSPAFSNSTFAVSVEHNILGGYLWVVVIVGFCCLGSLSSARIARECSARN